MCAFFRRFLESNSKTEKLQTRSLAEFFFWDVIICPSIHPFISKISLKLLQSSFNSGPWSSWDHHPSHVDPEPAMNALEMRPQFCHDTLKSHSWERQDLQVLQPQALAASWGLGFFTPKTPWIWKVKKLYNPSPTSNRRRSLYTCSQKLLTEMWWNELEAMSNLLGQRSSST